MANQRIVGHQDRNPWRRQPVEQAFRRKFLRIEFGHDQCALNESFIFHASKYRKWGGTMAVRADCELGTNPGRREHYSCKVAVEETDKPLTVKVSLDAESAIGPDPVLYRHE